MFNGPDCPDCGHIWKTVDRPCNQCGCLNEWHSQPLSRPAANPTSYTLGAGGLLLLGIAAIIAPRLVLPLVALLCFLSVIGIVAAYGIAAIVYAPFICLGVACYALIKYKTLRYIVIVLAVGFACFRLFLCLDL